MEGKHNPGPWRVGRNGSCVVADTPVPEMGGSDAVDYYGGHMIAESVVPRNAPPLAAAPELLAALQGEHQAIDWLMARLVELDPKFFPSQSPVWAQVVAGKDAIDKATEAA
jgi:hypothetical protein